MLHVFTLLTNVYRIVERKMSGSVDSIITSQNYGRLQEMIKSILPPLTNEAHKGQAGRIGIVGGCLEVVDLSHVFCTGDAGSVIKSYSPELIVHPILDKKEGFNEIAAWMQRLHAIVIGPGLGRDPKILGVVRDIIGRAKSMNIPIVLDADGLALITEYPDIIKSYKKAILTPNAIEFARLYKALTDNPLSTENLVSNVTEVAYLMGHVTVVHKGKRDIISDGLRVLACDAEGSPRRCGGQGDVLSGSMGSFAYWSCVTSDFSDRHPMFDEFSPTMCAAYAACQFTKECNRLAFRKFHRSMTTSDMIEQIPLALSNVFN
uniref:ATP-dependent (S)-NAD(P)H-hydrate dehydratase n=1 Tax=Strigamia maritima TaxID=126957 RepID=T1JBP1_STRMM